MPGKKYYRGRRKLRGKKARELWALFRKTSKVVADRKSEETVQSEELSKLILALKPEICDQSGDTVPNIDAKCANFIKRDEFGKENVGDGEHFPVSDNISLEGSSRDTSEDVEVKEVNFSETFDWESFASSKFMIYGQHLLHLVRKCWEPDCSAILDRDRVSLRSFGSCIELHWYCPAGHKGQWSSQPELGEDRQGDVELSLSIGSKDRTFSHFAQLFHHLRMQMHSFPDHQRITNRLLRPKLTDRKIRKVKARVYTDEKRVERIDFSDMPKLEQQIASDDVPRADRSEVKFTDFKETSRKTNDSVEETPVRRKLRQTPKARLKRYYLLRPEHLEMRSVDYEVPIEEAVIEIT